MCLPTEIPSYKCRRTVLVKTSSLPSLRSTSHGTFEHVEEPAYGGDDDVRHDESARFVGGLRGRVLVFSMQAQWWPHPVDVEMLEMFNLTKSRTSGFDGGYNIELGVLENHDSVTCGYPRIPP
ncbi:hypothetical protein G5I_04792 [Acromyrmex echinatior]|uniref:Uncharacterized protein n=1 Tax=Acromyrmex echinatior TaxID=103372 RepID=F4WGL0_ACREC|nr:hypothetical protein G5I_04792 [Acromyrmex echinatior]